MQDHEIIRDRITKARKNRLLTQKKLCELADITPTQLSRIESGVTETVSSDVLIKLAQTLNVSTDYILGLTDINSPKNYEISELGLSVGAVETIVSGKADIHALNALLENANFRELMRLMMAYFMDSVSIGIMARNDVMDFAVSSLNSFIKDNPDKKDAVKDGIREIRFSKIGEHEADIERIKSIFIAILQEIKTQIIGSAQSKPATGVEIKRMMAEIQKKQPKSARDVSQIVVNMVKQATHLNDEHAELYRQSFEQILLFAGKE